MIKEIIFYTHNYCEEPIASIVKKVLLDSELPIISCSLKPINFGKNIVLNLEPGIVTMYRQIFTALETSKAEMVFFAEHDVLYHRSHFEFIPPKDNVFYYNANNWRWDYPKDRLITYDRLISLSGLCANRLFALSHYKKRLEMIEKNGWDKDKRHDPDWARRMGYEPGTKKKKRGSYFDDDFETWRSKYPIIDIRHRGTFSPPKVTLDSFKHQPLNWKETSLDNIPGWNLREMFELQT